MSSNNQTTHGIHSDAFKWMLIDYVPIHMSAILSTQVSLTGRSLEVTKPEVIIIIKNISVYGFSCDLYFLTIQRTNAAFL